MSKTKKPEGERGMIEIIEGLVNTKLAQTTGAFNPRDLARDLCKDMKKEDRLRLKKFTDLMIDEQVEETLVRKTKPEPFTEQWRKEEMQGEMFPVMMLKERYISSAQPGKRIGYGDSGWADHLHHKAEQEGAIARQAAAYSKDQERRDNYKDVGMDQDPKMTTSDAWVQLGKLVVANTEDEPVE